MSDNDLRQPPEDLLMSAVGAALFASEEPVPPTELSQAFGSVEASRIEEAIDQLDRALIDSGSGLRVEKVAGGYRMATVSQVGPWVRQFFRQRNRTRLSPAALETLAICAYRQPVTAPEIQAIRGKDPSAALKSLLDKKMIRILGKKKVVGNPLLYGTSKQFLIHFGLDRLEDLPSIEQFDEFAGALDTGQAALFGPGPASDPEIAVVDADAEPESEPEDA